MSAAPRLRGMLVAVFWRWPRCSRAASGALGAGIQLDRSISPPQAVVPGTGTQVFNFNISFTSTANRYEFTVYDPNGTPVSATETVLTPGAQSPSRATAPGRRPRERPPAVQAEIRFFSSTGFEAQARVTFDVAAQLGSLRLVKFETSTGTAAATPVSRASRTGRSTSSTAGRPSDARTGTDGTVTINNVPAGTWRADEVLQNGWVAVTPAGGTVVRPAGGTRHLHRRHVRPLRCRARSGSTRTPTAASTPVRTAGRG